MALGGGSARGYAHLGALAALEGAGFAPDVIVGTSFGAVIGALYATGRELEALIAQAGATRRRDVLPYIADFGLHRAALFSGEKLEEYFDRLLEGRTFADLKRKLVVVTTDIDAGEEVLVEEGSLARALRASASIPGLFAPATIGGRRLVDGGIGSPVPISTLASLRVDVAIGIGAGMEATDSSAIRFARRILSSEGGRRFQLRVKGAPPRGALGRLGRALALAAEGWMEPRGTPHEVQAGAEASPGCRQLEVHLKPGISWLNFHRAREAIAAGEEAFSHLMPSVQLALGTP